MNGVIQVPRPTVTLLAMAARIPILQPLSRRTGPTCRDLPRPPRRLDVGPGLDGDIVLDGDQVERPGQGSIVCALKVGANVRAELPQHEGHQRRAAIHRTQRQEHHVLQPSDAPDSKMHPAPLGVHARGHIVLVDVATHEELDQHDPEQGDEGRDEGQQVQEAAGDDELPEAGGREERPDFDEAQGGDKGDQTRGIQDNREEHLQGGEVSDGEHLGRGLIARGAVGVGFHRSGRDRGSVPERPRAPRHLACSVAVAEQRPDRHHPSCSLQSLRQTRDGDRVPAGLGESIVQSQRRLEHGPADRQHLLTVGIDGRVGIRRFCFPFSSVARAGKCAPAGVLRFRLGISQQIREVWQTASGRSSPKSAS